MTTAETVDIFWSGTLLTVEDRLATALVPFTLAFTRAVLSGTLLMVAAKLETWFWPETETSTFTFRDSTCIVFAAMPKEPVQRFLSPTCWTVAIFTVFVTGLAISLSCSFPLTWRLSCVVTSLPSKLLSSSSASDTSASTSTFTLPSAIFSLIVSTSSVSSNPNASLTLDGKLAIFFAREFTFDSASAKSFPSIPFNFSASTLLTAVW